ncbi:MAG: 4-hydroxy-3-methylbut-2-enyl diphosphate reductase [candidate division WOR-3 bacterium]
MEVIVAPYAGFCSGVKRAIKLTEDALKKGKQVYTLGPIIHNPAVVKNLEKKGIRILRQYKKGEDAIVVIRSHGLEPAVLEEIKSYGYEIVDATCPYVRRAQNYVENLKREGYFIVIIGEARHPEVKGLLGFAGEAGMVYEPEKPLPSRRIGIVEQTTIDIASLRAALGDLVSRIDEIKVFNTICAETKLRINSALDLCQRVDLVIVVGGKNSANTTNLANLCGKIKKTYHIERAGEIKRQWLKGVKKIGVAAGTSTPQWVIDEVVKRLKRY